MKKYVKPELIFESFEMTQQIAACDYDSKGSFNDATCTFVGSEFPDEVIFVDKTNCSTIAESYCYHGSTGGFNIFNS